VKFPSPPATALRPSFPYIDNNAVAHEEEKEDHCLRTLANEGGYSHLSAKPEHRCAFETIR